MSKVNIIDLDECVINALEFFSSIQIPKIKIPNFKRPIVIGSGNAAIVGRILFEGREALFADESDFLKKLETARPDGGVIISSSGEKHAPFIASELKKRGIDTFLITNNPSSSAIKMVNDSVVFPKSAEPFSYNVSSYLGMILSQTKEDPQKIKEFVKTLNKKYRFDFKKYDSFFFIIPEKFAFLGGMFLTKFDELFGAKISARAFTLEQTKHAKTIVPSDNELFVSLGYKNKMFGKNRLNIILPDDANYGLMMLLGYYIIGKIQKQNPPYFKDNVLPYLKKTANLFGKKFSVIS